MNLEVDVERLHLAHKAVRAELLAERASGGHWVGQVAGSPLATAAAISALVTAHRRDTDDALRDNIAGDGQVIEQLVQGDLCELLVESVHWLARHQNPDGGWGDCDGARSNIAATLLVQAAFRLTGVPAKYADLIVRADDYVEAQGSIAGLRRRYGGDKMLVAPILANCALAGMIPWRQVPALPFELVCIPKRWQHHIQLPVARFATPIFIAVGRARFHHDPPRNPITRLLRRSMGAKSLAILERMQAADDSYLASPAFTAFVVMNIASIGCQEHVIVERGIEFLLTSVRADSSWSITASLATTNTALALNNAAFESAAYMPDAGSSKQNADESTHHRSARRDTAWEDTAAADETSVAPATSDALRPTRPLDRDDGWRDENPPADHEAHFHEKCLDWLLVCQRTEPNPLTEAPPGGWASSDSPGALPNTTDTAGALLALARRPVWNDQLSGERIERATHDGVVWLLDMQNEDGGWPTFGRDSSLLRFDESGADVTAHAIRALAAWQRRSSRAINQRSDSAINGGWRFLESRQREDGSFIPLWFGNEHQADDHNPVYGTAQVLMMCGELARLDSEMARRAARWLLTAQHSDGGWGPPRAPVDYSAAEKDGVRAWRGNDAMAKFCSVEETALAVTALLPLAKTSPSFSQAVSRGLIWLVNAVEQDAHRRPAVIGFYLSKLWYYERLYPLVFAAGALARAIHELAPERPAVAPVS